MQRRTWLAATVSLSMGMALLTGCSSPPTGPAQMGGVQTPARQMAPVAQNAPVQAPLAAQTVATPQGAGIPLVQPPLATGTQPGMALTPAQAAEMGALLQPGATSMTAPIGAIGGGIPVAGTAVTFGETGANGLVAFQSNRGTGGGASYDVFVFDAVADTVLALPGVNTPANEKNPRLSSNGEWLVYQSDESGDQDILLFSLRSQLINTMNILNTPSDEMQPDISDDGSTVVYVSNQGLNDELRVYDMINGENYRVPVANRGLVDINWPTISGDGTVVAYAAAAPVFSDRHLMSTEETAKEDATEEAAVASSKKKKPHHRPGPTSDVFVYSLLDGAQLTPPFINTGFGEYNPDLDATGSRILFVSDRRGAEDVYLVDMRSGFTDNLVLANSSAIEQQPRWLAGLGNAIIFQSDRTGDFRLFQYDLATALLDTLPVANEMFSDTQLRDEFPAIERGEIIK